MSSTMSRSFLCPELRDRECIQSEFVKLSFGFAVNEALSASAVHNSLIPIKKTVRTLYFWYTSHNTNNSTLPNSRIISFEFFWTGCRRDSAWSRHEVLLDEDDFRSFSKAHNCLWQSWFYNCMWQSWYSMSWSSLWSTNTGLPVLVWSSSTCSGVNTQRFVALVHIRVSPYLIIGFWVLVGFVGYLCCFQRHQNPNHTSIYLCRKFSVAEVTHIPSGIWFLQISSQLLSRYSKLGVYRRGRLRSILFDRTWILSVEQAAFRPSTLYPGAFSTFACAMQDVVWSIKLLRILVILIHGIHGCEEYRLSFLARILPSRYQSWICDGV